MNNTSPKILKGIRAAFQGFRWLFGLCLVGILIQLVVGPASITATVGLTPDPAALVRATGAQGGPAHLDALKADLTIPVDKTADAELKALARLATLPGMFVAACSGLILCEIVQRLIRNLSAGDLFSDHNLKLLRAFAIVLVAATAVERLLVSWSNYAFGKYAASHLTFVGTRVLATADHVGVPALQLNLGSPDILIGLLLLLMVWAFKEGAALKRDSELTV